ncbi:unnamed protein product [Ceutorhynchus assimilis]|uniref:Zinc finger CCCH-type with G patch domain-containing protein n=1 Tax=Ceutorhynchus assimilis TaxID=467358 RepID=A0A9N9N020_9CUCU|nr:unnamed protein product [Ceutorhynchus assimilis]
MASQEAYHHQLQLINQMLKQTPEGPERNELINLKENIEELLSLTNTDTTEDTSDNVCNIGDSKDQIEPDIEVSNSASCSKKPHEYTIEDEYELFMAEMTKEGAIDSAKESSSKSVPPEQLKDLEGKKFRAPHKHQWGQLAYHNAMVCSVPEDVPNIEELMVKILFLNPTHKEMLPCPYYFDLEKDCRFSEDECKFSHGEFVQYSSLQEYVEPQFEKLTKGSEVLAKQSDNLWYRGKISQISKGKCLVKFESKNVENEDYEDIIFEHILPLTSENDSEDDCSDEEVIEISDDESILVAKKQQEELINRSLMITPESIPLGDWEKYTKGIASKLMQKMGYVVGTGLGKKSDGILKPVTALVLPQGKSLDFCMNLKEQAQDPNLFNADKMSTRKRRLREKPGKVAKRKRMELKVKDMNLEQFIVWSMGQGLVSFYENDETRLLREKLKVATTKDVNLSNFKISEKLKKLSRKLITIKARRQRLEGKLETNLPITKKQSRTEITLKRFNVFQLVVNNELDRRKSNKEMAVF